VTGAKNRVEVHLPKSIPSPWCDSTKNTGENAFYVNADGQFPFAIYLDGILDFDQVTERSRIGSANEYPNFNKWVESNGTEYTNWYIVK